MISSVADIRMFVGCQSTVTQTTCCTNVHLVSSVFVDILTYQKLLVAIMKDSIENVIQSGKALV
jgi:hypothetical protein